MQEEFIKEIKNRHQPKIEVQKQPDVQLDAAVELRDGSLLRFYGYNKDGSVAQEGEELHEVTVMIGRNTEKIFKTEVQIDLRGDVFSAAPISDIDWSLRFLQAIAGKVDEWRGSYELYRVLDAVFALSYMGGDEYIWVFDEHENWFDQVANMIENEDYRAVWDFEDHRQEGDWFREWFDNTEELRR